MSLSGCFSNYVDEQYNKLKTAARLFGGKDVKFLDDFLSLTEKLGSQLEQVLLIEIFFSIKSYKLIVIIKPSTIKKIKCLNNSSKIYYIITSNIIFF